MINIAGKTMTLLKLYNSCLFKKKGGGGRRDTWKLSESYIWSFHLFVKPSCSWTLFFIFFIFCLLDILIRKFTFLAYSFLSFSWVYNKMSRDTFEPNIYLDRLYANIVYYRTDSNELYIIIIYFSKMVPIRSSCKFFF